LVGTRKITCFRLPGKEYYTKPWGIGERSHSLGAYAEAPLQISREHLMQATTWTLEVTDGWGLSLFGKVSDGRLLMSALRKRNGTKF